MSSKSRSARVSDRLSGDVRPREVDLQVEVDPSRGDGFRGEVTHAIDLATRQQEIRLHACELQVAGARIEWQGGEARGRIERLPEVEMIAIRFPTPVPAGRARLRLAFRSRLRKDLCGLYGASVGRHRYAFTQLEATDARKFFPCFDEPAMKARFRITVTTGSENAVVSNAPIASTRRESKGRKTVRFRQTPPLSTYLVALAVGELNRSRPVHVGKTAIRTWHTPGNERLTRIGLETAQETLGRLERYFGLPYPYEKLDLVAVPDFEFGAMENAGAVFFRETLLLLDPATATTSERKRAAEVIAHELAHMWYGDLVTMAWWDDLWLNEAFATWMAFAVVDDWKPEWNMWHDFQHGRAAALELDALRHTHPIYTPVRTAAEASQNFDLITYEKGAAVVRMLERYLGAATFRRGVRRYIRRHREGNTVAADLWRALGEASGEPVEKLARAWIEQDGYPVVRVRLKREGSRSRLHLAQERFTEQPGRKTSRASRWPIPIVTRVLGPGGGRGRHEKHLLTGARGTLDLGHRAPRLVYANAEEAGFFRPHHGERELEAILAAPDSLAPVERMGLADHQWALVRAGRAPLAGFLALVSALAPDRDPDVLAALHHPLAFLAHDLVPDAAPECADPLSRFIEDRFGSAFVQLGWKTRRGEDEATGLARAALLSILGSAAGSPPVLEAAARHCDQYLRNRRAVHADLADAIVGLAARVGNAERYRAFVEAMKSARTPQEHRRFLLALGGFRDQALIERTLRLSLTDTVPTQDVAFLIGRLFANPAARDATWDFVRTRWPRLEKRMGSVLTGRMIETTVHLRTPQRRREVAQFFRENPVPTAQRVLRQTLERFDWYRGFRKKAASELREALG